MTQEFDIYFPGVIVKTTYGPNEPARNETAFISILEVLMSPMVVKTHDGGFVMGTHSFISAN